VNIALDIYKQHQYMTPDLLTYEDVLSMSADHLGNNP